MNKRSRRAGFTLIELLVVISIIAVLAAIIMPVYRSAQERANQADCISHLHAVGVAMKLYQGDYHKYPGPVAAVPGKPLTEAQVGGVNELAVTKSLTSSKVLVCKDDSSAAADVMAQGVRIGNVDLYSSYNVNDAGLPVYNYYGLYPASGGATDGTAIDTETAAADLVPSGEVGPGNSEYTALMNPNAPDETVVTHCTYHRGATGGQQLDMVLHVAGDVTKEQSAGMKWMVYW